MNHDDDLREFFAALRARDEREAPPPFATPPVRKAAKLRRLLPPLAAAAAVALLLVLAWPEATPATDVAPDNPLTITIQVTETTQTQTLLGPPETMDSWESPSAWLIADF